MPISNRYPPDPNNFSASERKAINDALDELEKDPLAPSYKCTRKTFSYGDTFPTIEVVNGIMIDYKFDIVGLVTIIDIYRSKWHAIKVLTRDFSPPDWRI